MNSNGVVDLSALLQGAGKQLLNQGGQALLNYGAQALGNIINECFQKKQVEQRFLPSLKNYKVLGETRPSYAQPSQYQDFNEIRSRCLQDGRLFEDPEFPAANSSLFYKEPCDRPITWLRPHEIADSPQLFVEGFSRFDVQQGELGDCWLLAAVANLTLYRKLFFQVVPDDQSFDEQYAGVFHFRFWQYGRWVDVVIDDRLPTYRGELVFLHSSESSEFWSALLEKAYAKLHGSYEALKGGSTCEAMEDFTGGVSEMYDMQELPPNLFTILLKAYERNSLMGCSIEPDPHVLEAETPEGLIRGHAYSITRVRHVDIETPGRQGKIPLLRMRNPWGNEAEWNGAWSDKSPEWRFIPESEKEELGLTFDDDGEFWMSYKDFISRFSRVEICNLNPDSLDPAECPEGCSKKWEISVFEGEWVRGVTAGGCRNFLESFWRNPQYTVTLNDPDEDDEDNMCTIIVALMQKNRRSQRAQGLECLTIGFALYALPQYGRVPKPLDVNFFKYNASVARSQAFINLREVSCRFKLPPGTYVIVPSTFDPEEEGEFLLRVFSEKSNNMAENDEEIGMGDIDDRVKETEPEPEPADPVRNFFNRLAGDDGEVDWQELKQILDYSMREELAMSKPGPTGGDGGDPGGGETSCLEQLLCALCGPLCKQLGVDPAQLQQMQAEVRAEQPARELAGGSFSPEVCKSMIEMLDTDKSGGLGFDEFKSLWLDVRQWRTVFRLYDTEGRGGVPSHSLREALHSAGYTLNAHVLNAMAHRYGSQDGIIHFDDFIMCCVRLKTMIASQNDPSSPYANPYGNPGGSPYGGSDPQSGGNPYGGNPYGGNPYGGNPYGGNPYGGNPYGGSNPSGGNPYGGNPYGGNPYGGSNPSGGNPYGGNPYGGNPYGGNPYGGNPYGGNPYGGNPYGGSNPSGGSKGRRGFGGIASFNIDDWLRRIFH